MATVKILYSRRAALGSALLRMAAWGGQWSHCALVTGDLTVVEALAFRGVVETPIAEALARASAHAVVEVWCPDPDAAVAFARSQVGAGYDYLALLGVVLREDTQDAQRWQCAELVESALAAGGRQRWRTTAWRIHPDHSYRVI